MKENVSGSHSGRIYALIEHAVRQPAGVQRLALGRGRPPRTWSCRCVMSSAATHLSATSSRPTPGSA